MQKITAVVVTSVLPSHPSTEIVDETIASIRHHLPNCEIILQIDGLREEQSDRHEDYEEYKKRILWKCLHEYKNVLPVVFDAHCHQSTMMRATIDKIKTPLLLYMEGDTPLVTDQTIDWQKSIELIENGDANTIRYHFEAQIPHEHEGLMLGDKNGFIRTYQWSQRPHLTSVLYYKDIVLPRIPDRSFIEDIYHGVVMSDWYEYGMMGWHKHRLWIYYPNNGNNIKRSYHLDGRAGGRKFTSDDDVWLTN
jgi:hypothetical protein